MDNNGLYIVCECCGDLATVTWRYRKLCGECYRELRFGVIDATPARTFPSGHGCPLEPNQDDSSPYQDNAIRCLEG